MATSYTIPVLNGDGSQFKIQINLPTGAPAPAGAITWSNTTTATGILTPANDGRSALYTVVGTSTDIDVVTATVTTGPDGLVTTWEPGHLYYLNQEIVDQNGKVQKVTGFTTPLVKQIPSTFTPYAGSISNSPTISLAGSHAVSTTAGIINITGLSATVPTNWQVGDSITIANATSSVIDGLWVISFVGTHAVSFTGFIGTLGSTAQNVGTISNTSKGGEASILGIEQSGADVYPAPGSFLAQSGDTQFGTVLQSDGGGSNGDWPPLALAATSGNFNQFTPGATSTPSTNLAPVQWIQAGYSTGRNVAGIDNGPAGIDSPVPAVAWQQNTPYSAGFQIIDENGNIQKVELPGTSGTQYPTFSTSSTTVDNTVTWKYVGAATLGYSNNSSYLQIATYSEIGAPALGSFVVTTVTTTVAGSGVAVYGGTFPATVNALAGYVFTVAGFVTHLSNNGNFICTASTSTTLTLTNAHAITETPSVAGSATNNSLRAYVDLDGNVHVGWETMGGTVEFVESANVPPAFAASGTTIDGDLIWTEQSTASLTTPHVVDIEILTGAPVPYYYYIQTS